MHRFKFSSLISIRIKINFEIIEQFNVMTNNSKRIVIDNMYRKCFLGVLLVLELVKTTDLLPSNGFWSDD